jgi:hypothetical protein
MQKSCLLWDKIEPLFPSSLSKDELHLLRIEFFRRAQITEERLARTDTDNPQTLSSMMSFIFGTIGADGHII